MKNMYCLQCKCSFYIGTLFARTHATILDVTVGFDQTSYSIAEGAAPLNVCTILTGVADREVMVTLTTMSISAQGKAISYCFSAAHSLYHLCVIFEPDRLL